MLSDIIAFVLFLIIFKIIFDSLVDTNKTQETQQIHNEKEDLHSLSVTQPYVFMDENVTSGNTVTTYPPNDIVNTIQNAKTQINIVIKKTNLNDTCTSSKDCPDGLICANDGINSRCSRVVPIFKIKESSSSKLGEWCGTINSYSLNNNYCNTTGNLICVSNNINNTTHGVCANKLN
jgi:hypothetical protein